MIVWSVFVWSLKFLVISQVGGRIIDTLLRRTLRHRYTLQPIYLLQFLLILNLNLLVASGLLTGVVMILSAISLTVN